jgi:predicted deacetylase
MERLLCVVLHDAANETHAACMRVVEAIREVAPAARVPLTLLAVPRYHRHPNKAPFEHWLKQHEAAGDEIALHGYTHLDEGSPRGPLDRFRRHIYTRGEGEFSDLTAIEARARLQAGVRWFHDLQIPLDGFVAPAWLMSSGTWEALATVRLTYTCTLGHVMLLPSRRRVGSQSLVYSNANGWRRLMSRAWVTSIAALQAKRELLRLELHPMDAEDAALRRHWQGLLAHLLAQRTAVTLSEAARRCKDPKSRDQHLRRS